jgi:hypothetical protein
MKYIAKPVEVEAHVIKDIVAVADITPGRRYVLGLGGRSTGIALVLEDGRTVNVTPEMTARMEPKVGDYWVIQEDGYIYLNPKDVFERKYQPKDVFERKYQLAEGTYSQLTRSDYPGKLETPIIP